ncbi:MAG: bifunctional diguanylate cyclase/phosphodiesterase [Burkholderiales bacterium]|nr:bifunctional diguanylate cyclase/phosphodiesterase [Burkholderiales bacterium]
MSRMQVISDMLPTWASQAGWGPLLLACITTGVVFGALRRVLLARRGAAVGLQVQARATRSQAAGQPAGTRDVLTGLVTRHEFESTLEESAWQVDHKGGAPLAVLYVGLDDLRSINDGFGLQVGDALLVQAARRLSKLLGAEGPAGTTHVARVGGEEFALLVSGDEAAGIGMGARVCSALARPFEAEGQPLALTVSVGLACYPAHGAWSRLLPHAAAAMRHVRQAGGNGHAVYAPAMAVDLREQALLLQDLRQAVERGEFKLLYQPKVDAASLQITAAEALLRWDHPVRGIVPPAVFIPLAERHGLMGPIGEWVVVEACRQAAVWRESGLRMRIAINISGHQLRHDRFVAQLEQQTRQHGIPPARLTCEITESVAMEDTAQTRIAFQRLRRAGFHVSIDDFGTGHSSLAVLRRLPAAELKVDRSFVVDLEASESARSIVEAVLSVARTLGLRVVAEGVETEAQRDILVRMGCDELQGYLFARPMSAVALALWADGSGPGGSSGGAAAEFRPSLFDPTKPAPMLP